MEVALVRALAVVIETIKPINPVLAEAIAALCAPETYYHLNGPHLRNATVNVEMRIVNGHVSYVQPTIKVDLKAGTDMKVN